jgi:sulfur carrier protein ThiS
MKVQVKIIGALMKPDGKEDFLHELPDGSTIRDLLLDLGYNEKHLSMIMTAVNGKQKKHSAKLAEHDEIELSLPVGGG